jgi:hypothetical protein
VVNGREGTRQRTDMTPSRVAVCNKHRLGRCSSLVGNKWEGLIYRSSCWHRKTTYTTAQFLNIASTKILFFCLGGLSQRAPVISSSNTDLKRSASAKVRLFKLPDPLQIRMNCPHHPGCPNVHLESDKQFTTDLSVPKHRTLLNIR